MKNVIAIGISLLIVGCAVVKIEEHDGHVVVEKSFGVISLKPADNAAFISSEIQGFGVLSTPLGTSLGYTKQSITMGDRSCKVIVWLSEEVSPSTIEELKKIHQVCIHYPNRKN